MTVHDPNVDPVAELKANARVPFENARAMPKAVYTSEAFLEAELQHIFKQDWFCVGRADSLPNAGDYTTLDLAGQPIMVIRDADGGLRAQSNVCLHRMSTLLHGDGNTKTIVCPYHAWTYNLDGQLRGAPAMTLNSGFEKGDYCLPHYSQTFFETHTWDTNWKVLAENFMESYHLPVCHAGTIGGLSKLEEMVCPPGLSGFNYHTIMKDDTLKIALAHPDNTRMKGDERRTTYLLAIYPSLLITLTPGYFWYLSLHPNGVGKVDIRFGGGMSPEYVNDPESQSHFTHLKSLLDDVNVEDKGCTEKVYRGLCSEAAKPGHLSHLERPNYDFAQYLASRMP